MIFVCLPIALTLILAFSTPSFGQGTVFPQQTHYDDVDYAPRERVVDIERMTLDVRFEPARGRVVGMVRHIFNATRERVDSLVLDAIKINVRQASLNGQAIRHRSTDSTLTLYFSTPRTWDNKRDTLTISYDATPRKGIYFIGWNDSANISRKQIWTQGQAIDHRHWIPMYDEMNDRFITETIVRFDKSYEVLSNGALLTRTENSDGTSTWHYKMPASHAGYLLTIVIGKYGIDSRKSMSGIVNNLYYYPEEEFASRIEPTYRYSTEAMDFLETELAVPYPWGTYAQVMVQDFIFGAMENTTATTFGDFSFVDARGFLDRNYVNTNVHELTHQWFGDLITARSAKHLWLQESFATYYPKKFTRKYFGEDAYQWNRRKEHLSALEAGEKDRLPIVHPNSGSARIYPKGSAVIDMLNYVFGEETYRRVITRYLKRHAFGLVETNDLVQAFQDTTGISPQWFFDQWLYRGGEPAYKVKWNSTATGVEVHVWQTHLQDELVGPFRMPIGFELHLSDGSVVRHSEWVDQKYQIVRIPVTSSATVSFVVFDPGSWIIKKLDFKKPYSELAAQVVRAANMIDRYDALVALAGDSTAFGEKVALLRQVYDREAFEQMRVEVVKQIVSKTDSAAYSLIRKALRDPHADVRKAVLNALTRIPVALKSDIEPLLRDSSYAIVATVLEKLSEAFPESIPDYLEQTRSERGMYNQVRIKWLEISAGRGDKAAMQQLVDFGSMSFDFWTRRNAFQALKRLNYCDQNVVRHTIDAIVNPNERLAGFARDYISYAIQQNRFREMYQTWYRAGSWNKQQKDIVEKAIGLTN